MNALKSRPIFQIVAIRLLQVVITLAAICWLSVHLAGEIEELAWPSIALWPLVAGMAATCLAQLFFALALRSLISAYARPIGIARSLAIHFVPMLGKYVPGRVWTIPLSLWMFRRIGVNATDGFRIVATATGLSLATAAVLSIPNPIIRLRSLSARSMLIATIVLLLAILVVLGMIRLRAMPRLRWTSIACPLAWTIAAWIASATGFVLLVSSLDRRVLDTPFSMASLHPLSLLVGYFSILVPAGLGVRESIVVLGLSPTIGTTNALSSAVLVRATQTATEFLLMGVGWFTDGENNSLSIDD